MPKDSDWKSQLAATERYENIQRIQRALDAMSTATRSESAFALENEAYSASASRAEYDEACSLQANSPAEVGGLDASTPATTRPQPSSVDAGNDDGDDEDDDPDSGTRIGPYQNCRYIASGVTAEVYRCKARALKVIVETHNMAPHNPVREAAILAELKPPCIPLLETLRDQEQRFVLVFPYMPLTLATVLDRGVALRPAQIRSIFRDLFRALADLHSQGVIHRDVKPAALLLESPDGPAYLSDFGTAWHPRLSAADEPPDDKILDVGTGPYRAPETLFGDRSYGPAVDMWAAGAVLAEACRDPPSPLFESRGAHEDGNQLGLILSIFKTVGSPTPETWPEAALLKTSPFETYRAFEGRPWDEVLSGVDPRFAELVVALVRYGSGRASAKQALEFECLR